MATNMNPGLGAGAGALRDRIPATSEGTPSALFPLC